MASTDGRAATALAGSPPAHRSPGLNAWSLQLIQAHGLLLADEVFRSLRHGLLNRLTGLGALGFQLRRKIEPLAAGQSETEVRGDVRELFSDLSRQIGSVSESLDRRLLPAAVRPAAPCDVSRVARDLVGGFAPTDSVSFETESGAGCLSADVDEMELAAALLCLIENAVDAIENTSHGQISVRCAERSDGRVSIDVCDTGPGVTSTAAELAFERFFTTKPGHLGLGLNVAQSVAARWNAKVELMSRTDGRPGSRATLILPSRRQ